MENQPPPPPPGMEPEKKKGLPPLAWVGIGCGTLLVVAIILISVLVGTCVHKVKTTLKEFQDNPDKAAAEMVVRMNPDIEMVSQNDETGTMTVRVKESGETVTVSYKDLSEGRLTVKGKDGETTVIGNVGMDKVPEWVPRLENADKEVCLFHHEADGEISGVVHFQTSDSLEAVEEFFKAEAEKAGFGSSSSSKTSFNGVENATMEFEGNGRTLNITITRAGAGKPLMVQVGYKEKK